MKKSQLPRLAVVALAACLMTACNTTGRPYSPLASEQGFSSMNFDAAQYKTQNLVVDGKTIAVRAYENIVYVAKPVDVDYQVMNIYIPDAYFQGRSIGAFSAQTAPIFFPNQVGGYMPAKPATPEGRNGPRGESAGPSTIAVALSKGYVVASPGARGRTTQDASGIYTGKAPAAIVDLKAAVRYLHYNDAIMPGDAGKIISNGTSAGGAMSALLGASGNNADYEPYLKALGAAPARDDIYAVSAYCPITNLEHADSAYEWLFNGVNDYKKIDISMLDYNVQRKEVAGKLKADQIGVSNDLAAQFPDYLNSLKLRDRNGLLLSLHKNGKGSFRDYVKAQVIASAQSALDEGQDLSRLSWLKIQGKQVRDLNFDQYVRYLGRMKLPPAFDALDLSSGENQLFGTRTIDKQHFTAYAQQHGTGSGATQADAHTVKMMNAMNYIGAPGATTAQHWRIRHGTKDSDTSLAVPVILATTLQNRGYDVDFALPWDLPHSGDYDLDALFSWMNTISGK